jgi:hypothetical protein
MTTAALVIALIGSSFTVAQNGVLLWRMVKTPPVAFHHKVTRPLYRHMLKPIGKEIAK